MAMGFQHGEAGKRLKQVNKHISTHKEGVLTLNAKVTILAPELTSYLDIRNRFFATFCRDVVDNPHDRDRNKTPINLHLQSLLRKRVVRGRPGTGSSRMIGSGI